MPVKADFFFEPSRRLIVEDCDANLHLLSGNVLAGSIVERQVGHKLAAVLSSVDDGECVATLSANYGLAAHPQVIKVEPTQFCNMRCTFCSNPELRDRKHLRFASFAQIWGKVNPLEIVKVGFTGLGESMLNKDLWAMHALVKQHGIYTTMVTNGSLLLRNATRIIDSGIDAVAVSIETLDKDIYARDRVGGKLDDALLGIRHLATSGAKTPIVNIICAVKPGSEREVIAVIRYCRDLGLPQPKVYPVYERFSRNQFKPSTDGGFTMDAIRAVLAEEYGAVGALCREDYLSASASAGASYAELACTEPKRVFVIRADGSFAACNEAIFDLNDLGEHRPIGSSVADAWESDHYRRKRLSLYFRQPMNSCIDCNAYTIPDRLTNG